MELSVTYANIDREPHLYRLQLILNILVRPDMKSANGNTRVLPGLSLGKSTKLGT